MRHHSKLFRPITRSFRSPTAARVGPLLLTGGLLLAACGSGGSTYGSTSPSTPTGSGSSSCTLDTAQHVTTVTMQNIAFNPACIKVAPGTAVTFTNQDNVEHTVTTDQGQVESFDSGVVGQGASYQHTFGTAGTIGLFCRIHGPMMHATVIVDPSVTASAGTATSGATSTGTGGSTGGGYGTGG